jgi:hypothetical protein
LAFKWVESIASFAVEFSVLQQSLLPGFPDGADTIGPVLTVLEKDERVTYFLGNDNYFSHAKKNLQSRRCRFVLASLMENGTCASARPGRVALDHASPKPEELDGAIAEPGPRFIFQKSGRARPRVMTVDKNAQCAARSAEGLHREEVARRADIPDSTLRKAFKRKACWHKGSNQFTAGPGKLNFGAECWYLEIAMQTPTGIQE